jgi:uncharacterized protein YraI
VVRVARRGVVTVAMVLAVLLASNVSAAGILEPGTQAKVSGTGGWGLRLREAPSLDQQVLLTMPEGQVVDVLEGPKVDAAGSAWYKVAVGDLVGWSAGAYLAPSDVAVDVRGLGAARNVVVGNTGGSGLRLRNGPGLSEGILAVMPEGDSVSIAGGPSLDGSGIAWYQVSWQGITGWSMGLYLWRHVASPGSQPAANSVGSAPPATSGLGPAIVAAAQQYLGRPYRFGGNSPDTGFDCSGFVQFVLQQVGISVGRDAPSQYQNGTEVARERLAPGDLVFFQNTYIPGLSHVGIYVGNNQFIHANNEATGVIVSDLDDSYWSPRWSGARRLQ